MLLLMLAVAVMFFVAWNIGANNAANVMGISVGSGALSLRRAVVLVFALEICGAVFFGDSVARTVGVGIMSSTGMRMVEAVAVLFLVGAFITAACYFRVPLSMTQVLVGCVVGYGFAVSSVLNVGVISGVALSWLISPLFGVVSGFFGYYLVQRWFLSHFSNMHDVGRSFGFFAGLEVVSCAFVAFAQGANSIAAAVGVFSGVVPAVSLDMLFVLKIVGGAGIGVGMAVWGYRVMQTISSGIVVMNPAMCFVAQFAAAFVVLFFTFFGMPVSCVNVVVGTVIGVGLISGARTIHWKVIYEIVGSWVFVLPVSAFVSFLFIRGLIVFV
ncbi:MAG: hypothetical protein DRP85_08185 [Candidatus Makaraimicrobium thalassicum]|nr:MAG: hypothetical protein DRP85_08185 [Candidatus Omnitrophota bacterium]